MSTTWYTSDLHLHRALTAYWQAHAPAPLEWTAALVLTQCQQEPQTVSMLTSTLHLSKSRISRIVKHLVAEHYLYRTVDDLDRRKTWLRVTPGQASVVSHQCQSVLQQLQHRLTLAQAHQLQQTVATAVSALTVPLD